jgi:hypothetical protein
LWRERQQEGQPYRAIDHEQTPGRPETRGGIALFSAGTVAFLLLAVASSTQACSSLDLTIARWAQGVDLPGLAPLMAFVNFVTDGPTAVAAWAVAFGVLALRGRPLEALAILGVLAV